MEKGLDNFYDEFRFVQERRSKLSILKLGFVAGFFGIGSLKLGTNVDAVSRTALYLMPLVAVLFDLFGIASTITIKKLEAFLKKKESETTVLNDWKSFSRQHWLRCLLGWCNLTCLFLFTILLCLVLAVLSWQGLLSFLLSDWTWIPFVVPLILWVVFRCLEDLAKRKLKGCKGGSPESRFQHSPKGKTHQPGYAPIR